MNKISQGVSLTLICLLSLHSCHLFKRSAPTEGSYGSGKEVFAFLQQQQQPYETFQAKLKIKTDDGKKQTTVKAMLRMQEDSLIWATVTYIAGIEVARVQIDSMRVHILDRLGNRYIARDLEFISGYTGVPVDLTELQHLLVGQTPPGLLRSDLKVQSNSGRCVLSGNHHGMEYNILVQEEPMQLHGYDFMQSETGNEFQVRYISWLNAENGRSFPQEIHILTRTPDGENRIEISTGKVEIGQKLPYSFRVPDKYKRDVPN